MTTKYANKTSVPIDRSMAQIRMILSNNDADGVAMAETKLGAAVQFIFCTKPYKFVINYPDSREDHIKYTNSGKLRTTTQIIAEIDAEKRRLWRSLVLYIKAAIEAHNSGLIDLKKSMLAHMMLPSGKTMYSMVEGNLDKIEANPQFLLEQ